MVKGKSQPAKSGTTQKKNAVPSKQSQTQLPVSPSVATKSAKTTTSMPVVSSGITCSLCGIAITDDTKALHCDREKCEQWKCIDCLNISAEVYDHLISEAASSLRWFCEGCDKVVMSQTTVVYHEGADRINKLVSVVEKLVVKCMDVEDKLRNKGDHSMMLHTNQAIGKSVPETGERLRGKACCS